MAQDNGRLSYAEAGAAGRAMLAAALEHTGRPFGPSTADGLTVNDLRALVAVLAFTALWSKAEDRLHLDQLATFAYQTDEPTRPQRRRLAEGLSRLAEREIVTYVPARGLRRAVIGIPEKYHGALTQPLSHGAVTQPNGEVPRHAATKYHGTEPQKYQRTRRTQDHGTVAPTEESEKDSERCPDGGPLPGPRLRAGPLSSTAEQVVAAILDAADEWAPQEPPDDLKQMVEAQRVGRIVEALLDHDQIDAFVEYLAALVAKWPGPAEDGWKPANILDDNLLSEDFGVPDWFQLPPSLKLYAKAAGADPEVTRILALTGGDWFDLHLLLDIDEEVDRWHPDGISELLDRLEEGGGVTLSHPRLLPDLADELGVELKPADWKVPSP